MFRFFIQNKNKCASAFFHLKFYVLRPLRHVIDDEIYDLLHEKHDEENVDEKTMTLQKTQKVGSFFPLRLIGLLPRNPGKATINQSMSSNNFASKAVF